MYLFVVIGFVIFASTLLFVLLISSNDTIKDVIQNFITLFIPLLLFGELIGLLISCNIPYNTVNISKDKIQVNKYELIKINQNDNIQEYYNIYTTKITPIDTILELKSCLKQNVTIKPSTDTNEYFESFTSVWDKIDLQFYYSTKEYTCDSVVLYIKPYNKGENHENTFKNN